MMLAVVPPGNVRSEAISTSTSSALGCVIASSAAGLTASATWLADHEGAPAAAAAEYGTRAQGAPSHAATKTYRRESPSVSLAPFPTSLEPAVRSMPRRRRRIGRRPPQVYEGRLPSQPRVPCVGLFAQHEARHQEFARSSASARLTMRRVLRACGVSSSPSVRFPCSARRSRHAPTSAASTSSCQFLPVESRNGRGVRFTPEAEDGEPPNEVLTARGGQHSTPLRGSGFHELGRDELAHRITQ